MSPLVRRSLLGTVILACAAAALLRGVSAPDGPRRSSPESPTSLPGPRDPEEPRRMSPAGESKRSALQAALKGESVDLGPDVRVGTMTVEGAGADPGTLPDLGLTPSQRVLVEALLAERRLRLEEIALEAAKGPGDRDDALRLADQAHRVHRRCVAEIRAVLLPEQRVQFDALVESGRWGRYSFALPVR